MKAVSEIAGSMRDDWINSKDVLCEYVMNPHGPHKLFTPFLAMQHECEWCGCTDHYLPLFDPNISAARMWLCANMVCLTNTALKSKKATYIPPHVRRCQEWALFCEINGVGDMYHAVCFENIQQDAAKLEYMLKFCQSPTGILLMEGETGTGKTYAALGMCELFTRTSASAAFHTQQTMATTWQSSFKESLPSAYSDRLVTVSLLVIDDLGIGDLPNGFMKFFMNLINSRMQWKNRGTVISTNLKTSDLNKLCGEALADRLMTGQKFLFKGSSRRKQQVL